jgi:6-phosphogluconolactonase
MPHTIEVFDDKARLMDGAATAFVTAARDAIAARGRFVVALSGGSTPRALFELLASERFAASVDWSRVHVCWGDERAVPPDATASNYRMAREALLDHVPIPQKQVYRIQSELAPESAAAAYEETLRDLLPQSGRFDLILLGMGTTGTSRHSSRDSPQSVRTNTGSLPNSSPKWRCGESR